MTEEISSAENIQIERKEFGYRQALIQQVDRCNFLSSQIYFTKKKTGKTSAINKINYKYAVRQLAMMLNPYWDNVFKIKYSNVGEKYEDFLMLFGEIMVLMHNNNLLLEREYVPGTKDAI